VWSSVFRDMVAAKLSLSAWWITVVSLINHFRSQVGAWLGGPVAAVFVVSLVIWLNVRPPDHDLFFRLHFFAADTKGSTLASRIYATAADPAEPILWRFDQSGGFRRTMLCANQA
jgi:hypothetical protein